MRRILFPGSLRWTLIAAFLLLSIPKVQATSQNWQLVVGAESKDEAKQAMAFLPNEIWILQNDSITWTTHSHEGHTVTFLTPGQNRPSSAQGCATIPPATATHEDAVTPSGSSFDPNAANDNDPIPPPIVADADAENCVNSGTLALFTPGNTPAPPPTSYTVTFPVAGNFKFVCLIHHDMTGVVHVLSAGPLPHHQDFYDDETKTQAQAIIGDTDASYANDDHGRDGWRDDDRRGDPSFAKVTMAGEFVATGGGKQYLAIMRFSPSITEVALNANGQATVEFENDNPTEPHTVTFDEEARFQPPPNTPTGNDPPFAGPGSPYGSALGLDLAYYGTIPNPAALTQAAPGPCIPAGPGPYVLDHNCLTSPFLVQANQDNTNVAQPPPSPTRIFVTFTQAGVYNYYCAIHDELGMEAKVIVEGH